MKIGRHSLAYRLLVPILVVITVVSLLLLVLISRITGHILDDYYRTTLAAYGAESKRILDSALADLTTARLIENRAVSEAKQQTVIEAILLNWKQRGVDGVIIGPEEKVLSSTLPAEATERVRASSGNGHFHVTDGKQDLHGQSFLFPAWQWKVVTLTRSLPSQPSEHEVLLLVPIVSMGLIAMIAALFIILQSRLQRPVAAMVEAVRAERSVAPTHIDEFDQIGSAINDALARVRERTQAILGRDERIQLLLRSTAEGIYGIDTDGNCTFCNAACLRMLGYDREEELLGKNTHSIMHHSYPDGHPFPVEACSIYSAYRSGKGVHAENEVFWRKNGSPFPVEYWSYPLIEDGRVGGAVVTFIDITERLRRVAELREEKNKSEAIIAAIGDGISIQDRSFRVLYQNEVHKGFMGVQTGARCYEAYERRDSVCDGCPVARSFEDGKVHTVERTIELGGVVRHFEITTSALRDAEGAITAGIELVRDITERRRTENQLRQAQKMEAVGQLAGGIAHDFNNMLTAIVGYASLLKKVSPQESHTRTYAEQILGSAERAANMTRQILAFSRKQVLAPRPINLNGVVNGMERLIARLLGEDIEIHLSLSPERLTVLADQGQMEQVIMNLCTNARDAMPAGGILAISTETALVEEDTAGGTDLFMSGQHAVLSISDTGTGMDERTRERIFEPFFTTKEVGRGTGLGLSIVYGIIKQHNGQISVYSEPGRGTTFRIYLPLLDRVAEMSTNKEEVAVRGGTETVLVAEDSEEVRQLARIVLEENGYRVILAVDGEDAVRQFQANRDAIALCLIDLIMPKKNGRDAVTEMRALRTGLKIVYMSGYAADIIRERDLTETGIAFLPKPILPQDLLRTVRSALDS